MNASETSGAIETVVMKEKPGLRECHANMANTTWMRTGLIRWTQATSAMVPGSLCRGEGVRLTRVSRYETPCACHDITGHPRGWTLSGTSRTTKEQQWMLTTWKPNL